MAARQQILDALSHRLRQDWNPIGVEGLPENEYTSYAPQVLALLEEGKCALSSLAAHLGQLRVSSMGLAPHPDADRGAAERLIEWWQRSM